MKKFKTIIPALLVAITISSCYKKSEASFTTNKSEYIAGDTLHLKNTSTNGHSYLWALPNGDKVTSANVDYLIPRNQGFDKLTFILNAYSRREKKSSTVSNTVNVIPSSVFAVDSPAYSYYPLNVYGRSYSDWRGSWWEITANVGNYQNSNSSLNAAGSLMIRFSGSVAPTSGIYLLQPNDTLTSGHAYVLIKREWWEYGEEDYYSLSGQLNVNMTNGKVHVVFTHIDTKYAMRKISGDITVP